jgi:hypothetical protein
MASSVRTYPLPRPADDRRFTLGLTLEVAAVLERHGYPAVSEGLDFVQLQQALFGFLYAADKPVADGPQPTQPEDWVAVFAGSRSGDDEA